MNVTAVRQNTKIVSIRLAETKRTHAMLATEQRWCGMVAANEQRRISTSRERTVVRDILTKEHCPRKTYWKCCKNKENQGIGSKSFLANRFPRVTNLGCENSG